MLVAVYLSAVCHIPVYSNLNI